MFIFNFYHKDGLFKIPFISITLTEVLTALKEFLSVFPKELITYKPLSNYRFLAINTFTTNSVN